MARRALREFYLLPRGEQRALILLSLLLILSLLFRLIVMSLPDREPEGLREFEEESRLIRASLAKADSLQRIRGDSIRQNRPFKTGSQFSYPKTGRGREGDQPVDINRVDSAGLLPLPGIGPVFAGRMIRYRALLGGYVAVDQLMEIYGFSLETFNKIKGRIVIDTTQISKLDLNRSTFRELLRHPYLEFEDVKALVSYRDFKGTIESLTELKDNFILPDSVLQRVLPYLGL